LKCSGNRLTDGLNLTYATGLSSLDCLGVKLFKQNFTTTMTTTTITSTITSNTMTEIINSSNISPVLVPSLATSIPATTFLGAVMILAIRRFFRGNW